MKQYNNRNEGQMIFKNIFEFNTKGMLNDSEFCELMRLIYCLRWDEENYDPTNISDKVKIVWQGIEPTFRKSKSNAEYYDKKQNSKTVASEIEKPNHQEQSEEKNNDIVSNNTSNNDEELNDNNLQLLLGELENLKPSKNQSFQMVMWNNRKINNLVEENKINASTREKAWSMYKK